MNKIVVKSPAKINIGLNVINKRDDGFHNIETIFYPLNLFDEIEIIQSKKFTFKSNDSNLNKDKSNLIIRAKKLLEEKLNIQLSIEIYLNKNIPIGAGLGGGSSNAAATMIALTKLFNLQIDTKHLFRLALQLGSDVPFFLNPVTSFAESRGEVLVPINLKLKKYLVIVNPGIHISTKWAFGLITPIQPKISLQVPIRKSPVEIGELMSIASNDFEKIVFNHFPEIREIKDKMLEFNAVFSMMTGTGSTVWGIFDDEEAANKTELYFKGKNYFTYIQQPT